jgi:hypothetical protein
MTHPGGWDINTDPPLAEIVSRLREQAEYGARANNHASGSRKWKPEHFQSWHDAAAIEAHWR